MRGLGVATHWGRLPNWDIDAGLPLMKKMGVQYIRDVFSWASVEKTRGVYVMYPSAQHWLDAVNGAGIRVMAILHYGNKIYDNPLDPDAFANYAAWMAKNYKGRVAAWEIWNEPDNFEFLKQYGGKRDGSDEALWNVKYSEFVRKATAAIKAVDPDAVVLHNNEGSPWHYALQNHPQDYAQVDGVDLHPYPTDPVGKGAESRFADLDENSNLWPTQALGHALQCWVGENGFSTYHPKDPAHVHFQPVSEVIQAASELRTVLPALVYGVKASCVYDFIDETPDPQDVESNFGLVRDLTHQHEPKPAYYSLQRLARLLGSNWQSLSDVHAALEVDRSSTPGGPEVHWFKVGNRVVTILWRAGPCDVEGAPALSKLVWKDAPEGAAAEAVDLVSGKAVDLKTDPDEGGIALSRVPVGWAPVAIRWTFPGGSFPSGF